MNRPIDGIDLDGLEWADADGNDVNGPYSPEYAESQGWSGRYKLSDVEIWEDSKPQSTISSTLTHADQSAKEFLERSLSDFFSSQTGKAIEHLAYNQILDVAYDLHGNAIELNPITHILRIGEGLTDGKTEPGFYFENTANLAMTLVGPGDGRTRTYQTYTKRNPITGEIYSGRASGFGTPQENIAKRDAGHHMNDKGFGRAELDKTSSNENAIRGREQMNIDRNGGAKSQGGTSGNRINGISSRNKNRQKYLDAARDEFGEP